MLRLPLPLSGRDCLTLGEFTPEEMSLILDEAVRIKALQKSRIPYRPLRGRTLAMVFQKPSNRTRVSFEVGMYQLGGHALHLSPRRSRSANARRRPTRAASWPATSTP